MIGVIQDVKFWGKGSKQIYEWAKEDADEGVFFTRVFGYDYENADEDEWDSWAEDFGTDRLCNSSCYAEDIDGDSFMVHLYDYRLPKGVYKRIAESFPGIHAEGIYDQEASEYYGEILIEGGKVKITRHNGERKDKLAKTVVGYDISIKSYNEAMKVKAMKALREIRNDLSLSEVKELLDSGAVIKHNYWNPEDIKEKLEGAGCVLNLDPQYDYRWSRWTGEKEGSYMIGDRGNKWQVKMPNK